MNLSNVQDGTMNINLLGCKGRTFEWICKNRRDVIVWAQRKVPECSTDLFRLVQYSEFHSYGADATALERKWTRLREAHHEHMRDLQERRNGTPMTQTDMNGCIVKKRKLGQVGLSHYGSFGKYGFLDD